MEAEELEKWQSYQSRITKPRKLLLEAIPYVVHKGAALDLGAGSLYDSEVLLKEGFEEVVAVDQTPPFREVLHAENQKFEYVEESFEQYVFPVDHFDFISAQYALPFIKPADFATVWSRVYASLKSGGIFTGQLFGERDDWHENPDMTFHTMDEVQKLTKDFDAIVLEEREYTEQSARAKHWHYFDLILRKR